MGGPLLAAAGVAYLLMNFFVAVYAYPPVLSYRAYAPAWAEMALIAWTGLLTSGIAHLTHAHLKGRVEAATNTFGAA